MTKAELLKQILINTGAVGPNATDAEVQAALVQLRLADPVGTNAILAQGGYSTPWLTYLGLAAGGIALYLVWSHYQTKSLGSIERPDEPEDFRPRLKGLSKTLGHFKGRGCSRGLGAAEKYEFEPEIRLEGFRKRHSRSKR